MRLGRGQTIGTPTDPAKRGELLLRVSTWAKLDAMRQGKESRGDVVTKLANKKDNK